jgi:zinc transporter 7
MSRTRTLLRTATLLSALFAVGALATASLKGTTEPQNLLELSIPDLDNELQKCDFVKELNVQRAAAQPETSSLMKQVFGFLFPFGPAANSLLATAYISGPPSMLLNA